MVTWSEAMGRSAVGRQFAGVGRLRRALLLLAAAACTAAALLYWRQQTDERARRPLHSMYSCVSLPLARCSAVGRQFAGVGRLRRALLLLAAAACTAAALLYWRQQTDERARRPLHSMYSCVSLPLARCSAVGRQCAGVGRLRRALLLLAAAACTAAALLYWRQQTDERARRPLHSMYSCVSLPLARCSAVGRQFAGVGRLRRALLLLAAAACTAAALLYWRQQTDERARRPLHSMYSCVSLPLARCSAVGRQFAGVGRLRRALLLLAAAACTAAALLYWRQQTDERARRPLHSMYSCVSLPLARCSAVGRQCAGVGRLRRALLLLAAAACTAAALLYWRQQTDERARRPLHSMYSCVSLPLARCSAVGRQCAGVGRLRRALLLLAAAACTAAALLYWRQQTDERARRPLHSMYSCVSLPLARCSAVGRQCAGVGRLRRALLLLAAAACTAAALLYWRQQTDERARRPLHSMYSCVSLPLARCSAVGRQCAGVGRLRRALLLLAAAACTAAALLYWRQQTDERARRPLHSMYSGVEPQWTWICRNDRCERLLASESTTLQSLSTCNMLCASTQLWPQPTGPVSLATLAVPLRADSISVHILASPSPDVTDHLSDAFALMREDLRTLERTVNEARRGDAGPPRPLLVRVGVNGSGDPRMRLDTDESYKLSVGPHGSQLVANITAQTFCGARHGLETLAQLAWADPYAGSLLILEAATIEDAPRFKYRGLLLDTARNYFPVGELLRTIDAMGANKLNTFHWHASDSQAFPLRLASAPQLAAHGAYGAGAVYTPEEIRAVVRRARLRGIRVLLEVDTPAHVGRAWSWGAAAGLGHLAHCVEAEPWSVYCGEPPCGQLNPRNPHVYSLLEQIYAEIIQLTGVDDIFHLGGDEVSERCWTQHFNDTDPMELWLEFTRRAYRALERANGGKAPELTLLWSSRLTRSPYLERLDAKRIGVQVWGASRWPESRAVLDAGFRAVISHVDAWYLDCGFGSWRDSSDGHCGPYRSWQQVYEHRPWTEEGGGGVSAAGEPAAAWRVEGGAACQWTEQLGPGGLDARVWPRTAALAERLWSDRATGAEADVYLRLDTQRSRLLARGVHAAPLWPRWCTHNPHACL